MTVSFAAPVGRPLAPTGTYAAQSCQTRFDGPSRGRVVSAEDSVRPAADGYSGQLVRADRGLTLGVGLALTRPSTPEAKCDAAWARLEVE